MFRQKMQSILLLNYTVRKTIIKVLHSNAQYLRKVLHSILKINSKSLELTLISLDESKRSIQKH